MMKITLREWNNIGYMVFRDALWVVILTLTYVFVYLAPMQCYEKQSTETVIHDSEIMIYVV